MRALGTNVPASLRDQDSGWFGLTVRARTIVHDTDTVKSSNPQAAAWRLADRAGYRQ